MEKLVILAHPDMRASRINAAWKDALVKSEKVCVHDLYSKYRNHVIDVSAEQKLLERFDKFILQFPIQWYHCPSLLKLWLDDVFTNGWAYGENGTALEGKTMSIAVSTFSKEKEYRKEGRYSRTMEELTSSFEVTAGRVGMHYHKGYFLHSAGDISDEELARNAQRYVDFVTGI